MAEAIDASMKSGMVKDDGDEIKLEVGDIDDQIKEKEKEKSSSETYRRALRLWRPRCGKVKVKRSYSESMKSRWLRTGVSQELIILLRKPQKTGKCGAGSLSSSSAV